MSFSERPAASIGESTCEHLWIVLFPLAVLADSPWFHKVFDIQRSSRQLNKQLSAAVSAELFFTLIINTSADGEINLVRWCWSFI